MNDVIKLEIEGKQIEIYPAKTDKSPIVYLNTFSNETEKVFNLVKEKVKDDFTFVGIYNLDWNNDTTPWMCEPIFKNEKGYSGNADQYLKLLTNKIIPKVESTVNTSVSYRILSGYSLAGLFALYSSFNCSLFSKIGSFSSSLWYPDFVEYVKDHSISDSVMFVYLSLGDKESKTNNIYLKDVEKDTEEIRDVLTFKKVKTYYQLNNGNHYKDAIQRSADGIIYLLNN